MLDVMEAVELALYGTVSKRMQPRQGCQCVSRVVTNSGVCLALIAILPTFVNNLSHTHTLCHDGNREWLICLPVDQQRELALAAAPEPTQRPTLDRTGPPEE